MSRAPAKGAVTASVSTSCSTCDGSCEKEEVLGLGSASLSETSSMPQPPPPPPSSFLKFTSEPALKVRFLREVEHKLHLVSVARS